MEEAVRLTTTTSTLPLLPSTMTTSGAAETTMTTIVEEIVATTLATQNEYNWLGLGLMVIPLITIIGNLLVIVSVLRFRALHSAINFLILGLAVADLLVAVFVMPFAVYVHVQNGQWGLGRMTCDLYMAADVACSTASILLLAVISFDRYRAVSKPIQYSRQSQNIRRVGMIILAVWFISIIVAMPMVLGINEPSAQELTMSQTECRLYNPAYSLGSSLISFLIPCFVVIFVYARIVVALKKREKAAKMRRLANAAACSPRDTSGDNNARRGGTSSDCEEAGRIVAGPEEHEFGGSSTPRSSIDSLSEAGHVVTNDFVSEGYTTQSRRSSDCGEMPSSSLSSEKSTKTQQSKNSKKFMNLRSSRRQRRNSFTYNGEHKEEESSGSSSKILPSILRQLSRRSPRLFRSSHNQAKSPMVIENRATHKGRGEEMMMSPDHERPMTALTETETISASLPRYREWLDEQRRRAEEEEEEEWRSEADGAGSTVIANLNFSRSTTANSGELFDSGVGHDMHHLLPRTSLIMENAHVAEPECFDELDEEEEEEIVHKESQPTVTFSNTVHKMSVTSPREMQLKSEQSDDMAKRRQSTAEEGAVAKKILTHSSLPGEESSGSGSAHRVASRTTSNSTEGGVSLKKQLSKNGGLAVRLVKKTMKHEQSLKRKVSKNQRKEKRATKTLGIVVGIFLICWVPFFILNITNATLMLTAMDALPFEYFFYSTWLGYMNSFMNPIIYTIFNTEFRRAFKSIIFGRKHGGAGPGRMGVRV